VGTGIHKYTSFRAHVGPVRQLMSVAAGVLSVGPSSIQLTHRRGLVQWTIRQVFIKICNWIYEAYHLTFAKYL
jgi:hypothetical protein